MPKKRGKASTKRGASSMAREPSNEESRNHREASAGSSKSNAAGDRAYPLYGLDISEKALAFFISLFRYHYEERQLGKRRLEKINKTIRPLLKELQRMNVSSSHFCELMTRIFCETQAKLAIEIEHIQKNDVAPNVSQ